VKRGLNNFGEIMLTISENVYFSLPLHDDEQVKHLEVSSTSFFGVSSISIKHIFRAKSYVIRTLLVFHWSVQQTANNGKGMLFGCEQPLLWVA